MTPTTEADEERDVAERLRYLAACERAQFGPTDNVLAMLYAAGEITRLRSTSQAGGVPATTPQIIECVAQAMFNQQMEAAGRRVLWTDADPSWPPPEKRVEVRACAMAAIQAMLSASPPPPPTVDGMREALAKIESGSFSGISTLIIGGDWKAVVDRFQEIARAALAYSPTPAATEIREDLVQANAEPVASGGSVIVPVCQWRDIETAPKDGTQVLGWRPGCPSYIVFWGRSNPYMRSAWMGGHCRVDHIDQPTHWMPLPPHPDDRTNAPEAQSGSLNQNLPSEPTDTREIVIAELRREAAARIVAGTHDDDDRLAFALARAAEWLSPDEQLSTYTHASDCAIHNEPAYPALPCDCRARGTDGGTNG